MELELIVYSVLPYLIVYNAAQPILISALCVQLASISTKPQIALAARQLVLLVSVLRLALDVMQAILYSMATLKVNVCNAFHPVPPVKDLQLTALHAFQDLPKRTGCAKTTPISL